MLQPHDASEQAKSQIRKVVPLMSLLTGIWMACSWQKLAIWNEAMRKTLSSKPRPWQLDLCPQSYPDSATGWALIMATLSPPGAHHRTTFSDFPLPM